MTPRGERSSCDEQRQQDGCIVRHPDRCHSERVATRLSARWTASHSTRGSALDGHPQAARLRPLCRQTPRSISARQARVRRHARASPPCRGIFVRRSVFQNMGACADAADGRRRARRPAEAPRPAPASKLAWPPPRGAGNATAGGAQCRKPACSGRFTALGVSTDWLATRYDRHMLIKKPLTFANPRSRRKSSICGAASSSRRRAVRRWRSPRRRDRRRAHRRRRGGGAEPERLEVPRPEEERRSTPTRS